MVMQSLGPCNFFGGVKIGVPSFIDAMQLYVGIAKIEAIEDRLIMIVSFYQAI
jgi:hypothetical protein